MTGLFRTAAILLVAAAGSLAFAQSDPDIYTFPSGVTFNMPPDGEIRADSNPPEILIGRNLAIEMVDPLFIGAEEDSTLNAGLEEVLLHLLDLLNHTDPIDEDRKRLIPLTDGRESLAYSFINASELNQTMMVIRLSDGRVAALNIRSRRELTPLQRNMVMALATSFDVGEDTSSIDMFAQAQSAYDAGEYDEAVSLFSAVVLLDDNDPLAHHMRGESLLETGELESALAAYERAYALAPDETRFLTDIAEAHMLLGDVPAAMTALETLVDVEGEKNVALDILDTIDLYHLIQEGEVVADFYRIRALRLVEIGLPDRALDDLEIAAQQSPSDGALHTVRGDVLMELELFEDAAGAFTDALEVEALSLLFYQRGAARQAAADGGDADALDDALHDYQCALLLADETVSDDDVKAVQRAIETVVVTTSGFQPITDAALCVP